MDYSQTSLIINITLIVILVCGIFYFRKFRLKNKTNNKMIKILHTHPVGQKERLVLIEVNHTEMLLGVTSNNIQTLYSQNKLIESENFFKTFLKENTEVINDTGV